jgi:hypothetical protein
VSADLGAKIQLGLGELATIREQMTPLIALSSNSEMGDIETFAACAMLHSFYTEIEKILTLIAREWDEQIPSSDSWHKALLNQMAASTASRPAVYLRRARRDPKRVSRIPASLSRSVDCPYAME